MIGRLLVGTAAAVTLHSVAMAETTLDFGRLFDCAGARNQSYYTATYRAGGRDHQVEVWRDGDLRIKRRTDDAIETYLLRPPGSDEWTMSVLDLERHIRTDITRTNLLRIGHFTDWFAQAHALSRPRATYRLTVSKPLPGASPIATCAWYRLTERDRTTTICWSRQASLPLVIANADGAVVWRVTALDLRPLPRDTFTLDDRGFVRHDANGDIEPD